MKKSKIFKKAFIVFCCATVFFLLSYAYLHFNLQPTDTPADQKEYNIPYKKTPDDCGLAFILPDESCLLVYLNFTDSAVNIINIDTFDYENKIYYGYNVDFTIQTDYSLIAGIIDRVGGIVLETNGETLRYTGTQIVDIIAVSEVDENVKRQVVLQIFSQISKNNFSKDDFVYIIENSETNLTVPDCLDWLDYIYDIALRKNFVN